MHAYRVFLFGAEEKLRGTAVIEARDDADAAQRASSYTNHAAVELWRGSRRVARLPDVAVTH